MVPFIKHELPGQCQPYQKCKLSFTINREREVDVFSCLRLWKVSLHGLEDESSYVSVCQSH